MYVNLSASLYIGGNLQKVGLLYVHVFMYNLSNIIMTYTPFNGRLHEQHFLPVINKINKQ